MRLAQLSRPFVETYWESYLSTGYDVNTCPPWYPDYVPGYVDTSAYGYDMANLPVGGVDGAGAHVFNIAFANPYPWEYVVVVHKKATNLNLHTFFLVVLAFMTPVVLWLVASTTLRLVIQMRWQT